MPEASSILLIIEDKFAGTRIDTYISDIIENCSRAYAQKLVLNGQLTIEGKQIKPSYRLKPGDRIQGEIPPPEPIESIPENITINIIYEDRDIIIINKPAGIVVHPSPGHSHGTLVNGLLFHCPDLQGIGGVLRPGIVHRLDKDTSGIMVVAKNENAHIDLARQFKTRHVQKKYTAIIYGHPETKVGQINFPIGRDPFSRQKMSVKSHKGKSAETLYTIKKKFCNTSLVDIQIKTGRTHQIRVHFAAIHHPVIGDQTYGTSKLNLPLLRTPTSRLPVPERQMLHSRSLSFTHPKTKKNMTFEAPLFIDMHTIIQELETA